MRIAMLALAVWGSIIMSSAFAYKPGQNEKDAVAKEIDLKEFRAEWPKVDFTKPNTITNAEQLAKAVPDKEWQDKIGKQVDFAKQQLLFFSWSGSGGDKLSFKVENEKTESVVVFNYTGGTRDDERKHFHLYAIAKNATWRVERK